MLIQYQLRFQWTRTSVFGHFLPSRFTFFLRVPKPKSTTVAAANTSFLSGLDDFV